MLDEIRAKRDELYKIAKRYNAERLWVFGSCARKEERPDSDVDILVKFGGMTRFGAPMSLSADFRALLGRQVDVVSDKGLSPYIGSIIQKEVVPI